MCIVKRCYLLENVHVEFWSEEQLPCHAKHARTFVVGKYYLNQKCSN